jgi:glycosyltransferase involved in cell wall biosynthesis
VEFIPWKAAGREIDPVKDLRALGELLRILAPYRRGGGAVIHLHSSKAGFLGRLACRLLGIKAVIYTPHCGAFVRTDAGPAKRRFFKALEWIGARFAGTVVGCCRSEAELYRPLCPRKRPPRWVANGVEKRPLRREAAPFLVSFSGIAGPQKDPALFNRIALDNPALSFCWIGDGPRRDLLSAPNISVSGWLDREGVDALLARTAVYLSTAAWEGLPFGALEAMNAGCALLLRDAPGSRDLVKSGENGRLFSGAEEGSELLRKMLADRERTGAMGMKSRELAETLYSAAAMGREYGALYAALASGRTA